MPVTVVRVGRVRVRVLERLVPVRVRVRLRALVAAVGVPVVLVVRVQVLVLERLVPVAMRVPLGQEQRHAARR